jgi:hypothetical protein
MIMPYINDKYIGWDDFIMEVPVPLDGLMIDRAEDRETIIQSFIDSHGGMIDVAAARAHLHIALETNSWTAVRAAHDALERVVDVPASETLRFPY